MFVTILSFLRKWLDRIIHTTCVWCFEPTLACQCGKGSSSTVIQQAPLARDPITEEEKALIEAQTGLVQEEVRQAQKTGELLDSVFPLSEELAKLQLSTISDAIRGIFDFPGSADQTQQSDELRAIDVELGTLLRADDPNNATRIAELEEQRRGLLVQVQDEFEAGPPQPRLIDVLNQAALADVQGEGAFVPEDVQQAIDTIFDTQLERGSRFLNEFARDAAAKRGLTLTDSPIFNQLLREQADLVGRTNQARAGAALEFGERRRQFQESQRQFEQGRLLQGLGLLTGVPIQPSATTFATLANVANTGGLGLLSQLQSEREPAAILQQTRKTASEGSGIGGILGGLGSLVGGVAGIPGI